jgi:hypothetical protein
MIVIAAALACALCAHPRTEYRRKPSHPAAGAVSAGPSVMQERALRRRLVRLARIKMLERRQAMLFDSSRRRTPSRRCSKTTLSPTSAAAS